jgi:hypothetical protein
VSVLPCVNSTTSASEENQCASPEEITTFINKAQFIVANINKYFEQDNFENPI